MAFKSLFVALTALAMSVAFTSCDKEDDDNTSTLDRVLIYAAIIYTILPCDLVPSAVYKFLGVLDDGAAMLYVYKKIKNPITPEINAKVEDTLNDWFGVEYEMIEEQG